MLVALTGIGLSAAAGLNAYVPFLVVALLARLTDVVTLPSALTWMESWWAIGVGTVLLLTDVVLDKVPLVDTVNDAVQTVIRPATGGVVFAATAAAEDLEGSTWVQDHPWVAVTAGVVVAALVHAGKATARPLVNAATAGTGGPVVSAVEDGVSVGLSLLAVFVPVLVVVVLGLLVWGFVVVLRRRRRRRPGPAATPGPVRGRF
ncbi:DUF4126 domain-containing protein [Cellulomonas shaoxiangyii]|uniref:DUF4126 domain-containing protein n=1 Tax=Cellulomonas shaoxiangyii TaxID=2566013 RepID=A0A4P7SJB9_9CELL|nr:DUF4126 domain-containing protein [Cellulomonas shaoxiangyii]QCB93788.1 DUF4126 domain-containing protein [Cellulomonas shaoxiangyii]TGY84925.1 DUF4126 domain-containing protein [Cellulomonas shaoxiangyii]